MEITNKEDITGDKDQGSDETMFNKINSLFREATSDMSEGQDLLQNTKAQTMTQKTSHKKKSIRNVRVRAVQ